MVQPAAEEQCCPPTRGRTGAAGQRTWTVVLGGESKRKSSGASQIVQKTGLPACTSGWLLVLTADAHVERLTLVPPP